ncbi:hypothetical protein ED733_004618 [Metarhizium rileyi]|uniref:Xylanolytic transcriptional activator regulatory domain-containing protein n=1 Tax=Metarhizium rileyi (strain RCEF 4871) TaxID=1649241 RepID=A0A5C6GAA0_METRR|nr:hypothetical protein ED733_004618 [Metarhizium rileyi]
MEQPARPLTRRPRAVQACNTCRQTKSKASVLRAMHKVQPHLYLNVDDECRAHIALANRVRELEARLKLASAKQPLAPDAISPSSHGGSASSPAQAIAAQSSHAHSGSLNSDRAAETTADAIATGLFDDQPGNAADIGYFGASSNHAFFWSLISYLEELDKKRPGRRHAPLRQAGAGEGPRRLPLPPLSSLTAEQQPLPQGDSFPGRAIAIDWVHHFFDTVAPVFPFVNKSMLIREIDLIDSRTGTWHSCPSNTRALMNIVFAHALATWEDGAAEPFYRRALSLLDEKGLYLPTVEALQALLLLASFQQNSQRAQESITTHFRAVKAAYQLGVHSPSSYSRLGKKDTELRSILWFAVINEDRIIASGLGRPFLVPALHVRVQLKEMMNRVNQSLDGDATACRQSLHHFRHVIQFHEIIGNAVDMMHDSNITSTHDLTLSELVLHVVELLRRLEKLRRDAAPHILLVSNEAAHAWLVADLDRHRREVLSSFYHYRVTMLVNAPLLLAVLRHISTPAEPVDSELHVGIAVSILQAYLQKLDDLHNLLCTVLRIQQSFLRRNAAWWLCNYMMVSMNLHLLCFWLISSNQSDPLPPLGMTSSEIETLMRRTLDTLKLVGGSSIMSRKAHRCLQRYLDSSTKVVPDEELQYKSKSSRERPVPMETTNQWPCGLSSGETTIAASEGLWASSMDDLMSGLRAEDFLGDEFFAMSYTISDFDATGFI